MEIYERIEGYEHHEVSNLGNVRRIKTKDILEHNYLDYMSYYTYEGIERNDPHSNRSRYDEPISLTNEIKLQIQRLKDMCSNSETDSDTESESESDADYYDYYDHESDSIRRVRNRNDNYDSDSEDFCECDCDE